MHVHDQFIDDGTDRGSRVILLIQNPRLPEAATPRVQEKGIIDADVAILVCSDKTGREPVLFLRNRFSLLKTGASLTLRYFCNDAMFPGACDEFRKRCECFAELMGLVIRQVVRKSFPEKAHLL